MESREVFGEKGREGNGEMVDRWNGDDQGEAKGHFCRCGVEIGIYSMGI